MTRLHELAETTELVRATSSRKEKGELLAALLRRLAPAEIVPTVGMLLAKPRQGAIGVGWATVAKVPSSGVVDGPPTGEGDADVLAFDALITEIATTTGPGSEAERQALLVDFLGRCEPVEGEFVRRVLIGDARQGALAGVMTDAAAKAAGVKTAAMRRAVMLRGDLGEAAAIALLDGADALDAVDLEIGRPIQPMLASTAADVGEAIEAAGGEVSVEWKLDGARVQIHLDGDEVAVYTRNLNDVTARLPQVVEAARALDCDSAVIDGEILGLFGDGELGDGDGDGDGDGARAGPLAFQETMSALGSDSDGTAAAGLRPYFFDLMALDGASLIDRPLRERLAALHRLAPGRCVPQRFTRDQGEAEAHLHDAIARGHEGVMVKGADSTYEAGRRGKSWRKVKPVHTLDLVVLAAEWGHGRRQGWLSNLHLGARHPETGDFVMVGKTFKGLTDELLGWQTEQFLARQVGEAGHTVRVRPELVVEIALDGAQASTRYPGGVALRFARVRGYRPDRDPDSADTLDAVRALLPRA
ncbi:MAG: ATP-dependent DNA ligase [Actinomycetota bacterium]